MSDLLENFLQSNAPINEKCKTLFGLFHDAKITKQQFEEALEKLKEEYEIPTNFGGDPFKNTVMEMFSGEEISE